MVEADFFRVFQPYYQAFAEHDESRRLELLRASMTETAEIRGPKRLFSGHQEISEKIAGFHKNWPGCRLVLDTGLNIFLNSARVGGAIVGPDGAVCALGEAVIELAPDGRIQRVLPFWEQLPSLPESWPRELAGPPRTVTSAA
jgi:hypothetical protein